MKRTIYLKNVFILAGICILCSCNQREYHKITIAIDNSCTLEQQTATYEVINKRVSSIWRVKGSTNLINGKYELTYSGQDSLLSQILTQKGEVYITEVYQQNEIRSPLYTVYEKLSWLTEHTEIEALWQINSIQFGTFGLIRAPLQQFSYIDSIFNAYQQLFPPDISFAWIAKPNSEGFSLLFPLKSFRKLPLNPSTVKKCNIEKNNIISHQELVIEFNKEYIEEWASMTRDNRLRSLAIVMDGKVFACPAISGEIAVGRLSIYGYGDYFDNNELSLIKSVILGGVLDCKAQIVN